jgi:hypothetical protein
VLIHEARAIDVIFRSRTVLVLVIHKIQEAKSCLIVGMQETVMILVKRIPFRSLLQLLNCEQLPILVSCCRYLSVIVLGFDDCLVEYFLILLLSSLKFILQIILYLLVLDLLSLCLRLLHCL